MRNRVIISLICLLVLGAVAQVAAAEMRGLWVDAYHPGFKTPEQTAAMVAMAKECNFNTLFVQVRKRGDVYYRSKIEPMAVGVAPGYDPLADVIAKAHTAGLKVHAWITVYEVYNESKWNKSNKGTAIPVHKTHPEWIMKSEQGADKFMGGKVYLDPALPQVKAYLAGVVEEVVKGYDVDGIHYDVLRYPCPFGGYTEECVSRFNQEKGRNGKPKVDDKDWCDWRRTQVTDFVRQAAAKVKASKRDVQVSAAVSQSWRDSYENLYQDWKTWLESGVMDFVVTMNFAADDRVFSAAIEEAKSISPKVLVGQGGYKMSADRSLAQIDLARKAGAKGVVVYSYAVCSKPAKTDSVSLMNALKAGPFAKPDVIPAL